MSSPSLADKKKDACLPPPGSPKPHPPEDICSSKDHDTGCFSLMGWADTRNVASWLNMPSVFKVECASLGANISGSITREMKVVTKEGPESVEKTVNLVRKIGVHDKGLGRCREAVFYLQFAPPEGSTESEFVEKAKSSPLQSLRKYIPKCYFAHFDNTSKTKEKMAIVIEHIDGVDAGYFFGRHSPLNWKFKIQDELDKLLQPWTERGINERHICIVMSKIAAQIHGPYWNKLNLALLQDPTFEHAARRDLYQLVLDEDETGDEPDDAPSFWREAIDKARVIWDAEKKRIAEASTNSSSASPRTTSPSNSTSGAGNSVSSGNNDSGNGDNLRPFGFSELVTDCLEKSFEKTTWKNVLSELRSIPSTFVHGDFHPANMIVQRPSCNNENKDNNTTSNKDPSTEEKENCAKLFLVDYEMFGFGSGPQEVGQFMISHCKPATRKQLEGEVVENYIRHLRSDFGVAKSDADAEWINKEYVRGGIGRWLWFLPILMNLGSDKNFRRYFHDQVYYFMVDHGVTPDNVPLIRV